MDTEHSRIARAFGLEGEAWLRPREPVERLHPYPDHVCPCPRGVEQRLDRLVVGPTDRPRRGVDGGESKGLPAAPLT